MRKLLCLAMLQLCVLSPSVLAAPGGDARKSSIKKVGVDSLDAIFVEARQIDNQILSARAERKGAREDVNTAMALDLTTSLPDALQELRSRAGSLQVAVEGGAPALKSSGALPEETVGAVTAVNSAMVRYTAVLADLSALPEKCTQIAAAAQRINPGSLQQELLSLAKGDPVAAMNKAQRLQTNIQSIARLPKKLSTLIQNLKADLTALRATFR